MNSFWSRLKSAFRPHLGEEVLPQHPLSDILGPILSPLDQLRHQALKEKQEQEQERKQVKISPLASRLREDILQYHQLLKTELNLEQLQEIDLALRTHCETFRSPHPDELSEYVVLAVFARLHDESLKRGLDDFDQRLTLYQLSWPPPSDLSPNSTPEEVQRASQLDRDAWRRQFLRGPLARFSGLLVGEIWAWRDVYPQPDGSVWKKSVYEAVAAALAGRCFIKMEKLAQSYQQELEKTLAEELPRRLAPLKMRLETGVTSMSEARNLSDQAVTLCQQLASEKIWQLLSPHFQ